MQCPRCNGLMVLERFDETRNDTGEIHLEGLRCVLCGEMVDPTILANRMAAASLLVH